MERELELIDEIYDALDRGQAERAVALALDGLEQGGEDPVLRFLAGRGLFEAGEFAGACEQLERATEGDPDDAEFRAWLAWAEFRAGRYADARREVERALLHNRELPEAHWVRGLVLEREGRHAEADAAFGRAAQLEPEWFVRPRRLAPGEFDRRIEAARAELPPLFAEQLSRVTVIVEDLPSDELLEGERPRLDGETLLGLFVGHSRDVAPGELLGDLPPTIYLFRRNLEREAQSDGELTEQIRITLYHELGHYLGLDEEELADSGYG